jgi:hypothetical protein
MFHHHKNSPRAISLDVAKEIGRRGFPAKAKPVTVMSAAGNFRRHGITIPGRGVVAVDSDLNFIIASYNSRHPWTPTFKYESTETAAENILRNLPLP